MAFTIDPDSLFPKLSTPAGRKERETAPNTAGKDFASTLLRAGMTPEDTAGPKEAGTGKKPDTDQAPQLSPLLYTATDTPADTPEGDAAAADPDPDTLALTMKAGHPPAQPITGQAPDAMTDADETAEDADATAVPAAMPAETSLPVTAADSEAELETTIEATASAQAQSSSPKEPQAHKAAPATSDPAQKDAPAATSKPAPEVQALAVPAAAVPEAKPDGKKTETAAASAIGTTGALPSPAGTQAGIQDTAKAAAQGKASSPPGQFRLPPEGEQESAESISADLTGGEATGDTAKASGSSPSPDATMLASGQPVQSAPATPAPASQPIQVATNAMTPTNAIITASPADTVRIISESIASPDDKQDRITVQLDPPELGRVSIDFRFNAHGLQHVTITGENPEALRQLRLMHFELTQALENNGLSSENMTFQQQTSHQQQQQQAQAATTRLARLAPADTAAPPTTAQPQPPKPVRTAGGGLDIRV